ncbi:MAG: hypothetical protein HKN43_04870 [Rhodothermales bacterium]|nr:hypothetical protein [Rhodothermales bacterium]
MVQTSEHIISRAIGVYREDIKTDELCELIELERDVFNSYFDSVDDLWRESYVAFLDAAVDAMSALPDIDDSLIQERLATLVFILLDVLEEHQSYVNQTFRRFAAGFKSPFQQALRDQLGRIVESPDVPGINQLIFGHNASLFVLSESIVQLINIWRSDDSTQRERSSALIDRYVSFWTEIISSGVPERTVDLIRYSIEADYLPLKNVPFVKDWFRSNTSEPDSQ